MKNFIQFICLIFLLTACTEERVPYYSIELRNTSGRSLENMRVSAGEQYFFLEGPYPPKHRRRDGIVAPPIPRVLEVTWLEGTQKYKRELALSAELPKRFNGVAVVCLEPSRKLRVKLASHAPRRPGPEHAGYVPPEGLLKKMKEWERKLFEKHRPLGPYCNLLIKNHTGQAMNAVEVPFGGYTFDFDQIEKANQGAYYALPVRLVGGFSLSWIDQGSSHVAQVQVPQMNLSNKQVIVDVYSEKDVRVRFIAHERNVIPYLPVPRIR